MACCEEEREQQRRSTLTDDMMMITTTMICFSDDGCEIFGILPPIEYRTHTIRLGNYSNYSIVTSLLNQESELLSVRESVVDHNHPQEFIRIN